MEVLSSHTSFLSLNESSSHTPNAATEEMVVAPPLSRGDLWKEVFPFGREWDRWDSIHLYEWDFSNLEKSLEEDGELYGQNVYLFGSSGIGELVFGKELRTTRFPIVVAVVSPSPPCDKLLIFRGMPKRVSMEEMNVGWIPYFPRDASGYQVGNLKGQIFILGSKDRSLRNVETKHDWTPEYYYPWFFHTFKRIDTNVDILYQGKLKHVSLKFDYLISNLQDLTERLIKEGTLTGDEKDAFQTVVRRSVWKGRKADTLARKAEEKAQEEENTSRVQNLKFYKFYPVSSPCTPDPSRYKNPVLNRYVRNAYVL